MITIKVKGINTPKNIINGAITQDSDIEALFWSETVNDDKETRKILKEIEQAEYGTPEYFIDRFGLKVSMTELSTSAKAAILVHNNPGAEIDLTEVGINGRDTIIKTLKNGSIILPDIDMPISYDIDNPAEGDIDVEFNGYHFSHLDALNMYFTDWYPNEPDLDWPGVEKL